MYFIADVGISSWANLSVEYGSSEKVLPVRFVKLDRSVDTAVLFVVSVSCKLIFVVTGRSLSSIMVSDGSKPICDETAEELSVEYITGK